MEQDFLKGLNPSQAEAVSHGEGPLLILAGPGSGKTRVITRRIAYLIGNTGVSPREILAVTFTNKAAREMKRRSRELTGGKMGGIWVNTFHSACLKMLRSETEHLSGYMKNFVVYDQGEQTSLITKLARELSLLSSGEELGEELNEKDRKYIEYIGNEFDKAENTAELSSADSFLGETLKKLHGFHKERLKLEDRSEKIYSMFETLYSCYRKEIARTGARTLNDLIVVVKNFFYESPEFTRDLIEKLRKVRNGEKRLSGDRFFRMMVNSIYTFYEKDSFEEEKKKNEGSYRRVVELPYILYKKELVKTNAVTFNDLILLTNEILSENPRVLRRYQDMFSHMLVDEYQDTNVHQYKFMRTLSSRHKNLFVVGDDDQAIYGWRGANIKNIQDFEKDFPRSKVVKLERNYRSTKSIVNVANKIIRRNSLRKEKTLWTKNPSGEKPEVFETGDVKGEALFVAMEISELVSSGHFNYDDIAVLYRTKFQARELERMLIKIKIPHVIVSGVGFFQKEEIKNILDYLRLVQNPEDRMSFERVVNVPPRGIKKHTINRLYETGMGPLSAIEEYLKETPLRSEELSKLDEFLNLVKALRRTAQEGSAKMIIEKFLDLTSYMNRLDEDAKGNVKEFLVIAEKDEGPSVCDFLDTVSLYTEEDGTSSGEGRVSLMTIHAAKGLEFSAVFIIGVNEGRLPHNKVLRTIEGIEEERRLFYVAVTRAKNKLFLSFYPEFDRKSERWKRESIFLQNLSSEHVLSSYRWGNKSMNAADAARLLMDRGINALYRASSSDDRKSAFFAVDRGANVNTRDNNGRTPLHLTLLDVLGMIDFVFMNGGTPLRQALLDGYMKLESSVSFLIKNGADINARDNNGRTPLHLALVDGYMDHVRVHEPFRHLHLTLLNGYMELASFLIKNGADINAKDEDGYTLLHRASLDGYMELVSFLVENGADVNAEDVAQGDGNKHGATPLHLASLNGDKKLATFLVKNGADINAEDGDGRTPLHMASIDGSTELASFLIANGADINARNKNGETPLCFASSHKNTELMSFLVGNGAKT